MTEKNETSTDISSLKLDLMESIDKRVTEQFDRAREFLQLTIGTAMKVLAGALALFILIVGLFGWKTASDIKRTISDITSKEVKRRLDKTDPVAKYRKRVDALYDQALVDSLYISISRSENDYSYDSKTLSSGEQQRLLNLISSPDTDFWLFLDAEMILRKGSSELWPTAAQRYQNLIEAIDPRFKWIAKNHSRVRILIEGLTEKGDTSAKDVIRPMLREKIVDDSIRIAAIRFAANTGDLSAINDIEALAKSKLQDIRENAILALANLKPTATAVSELINNIESETSTVTIGRCVYSCRLFVSLLEGNPKIYREDPDRDLRKDLAKRIFNTVFKRGLLFAASGPSVGELGYMLTIYDPAIPTNFYGVPPSILFGLGESIVFASLRDRATDITAVAALIDMISVRSEDFFMQKRRPHVYKMKAFKQPDRIATVHAKLQGDAILVDSNMKPLTAETAPRTISLTPVHTETGLRILATWKDSDGVFQHAHIIEIKNAESIAFSLESDVKYSGYKEMIKVIY